MLLQAIFLTALATLASCVQVEVTDNLERYGIGPGVIHVSQYAQRGAEHAYRFNGIGRGICLGSTITKQVTRILSNSCSSSSCFTFSTHVRLERKRFSGVLFSIKSPTGGLLELRYLKSIQFRLAYHSNGVVEEEKFYHGFARNTWQHLVLAICPKTGIVHVYLDCLKIFETRLDSSMDCFQQTAATEQLCVGERANGEFPFLGSVQNMTFYSGSTQIEQMCPQTDSASFWKQQYETLLLSMNTMERRSSSQLQECLSELNLMRCVVDGQHHMNGSRVELPCRSCLCMNGELRCTLTESCAPRPACTHGTVQTTPADITAGQCCDQHRCVITPTTVPPGGCKTDSGIYSRGQVYYSDNLNCTRCVCNSDGVSCQPTCSSESVLRTCPSHLLYKGAIDCCYRCLPTNFCASHRNCGTHGQCKNFPTHSECQCTTSRARMDRTTGTCITKSSAGNSEADVWGV